MRPALALVVAGCTFTPPELIDTDAGDRLEDGATGADAKGDAEEVEETDAELDAGEDDAGGDAGEPGDGGNRAPIVRTAVVPPGIPWDTFTPSAAGSTDPDGDPLVFAWTLASAPAGAAGGFAPFPVTSTAAGPSPALYADRPGTFLLRVDVSDGARTTSATVTITVGAFAPIPPPPGRNAATVKALDVDPMSGRVYLGTMLGGQLFDPPATTTSIPCITNDKTNDIAVHPNGRLAIFGFDDSPDPITATGTTCQTLAAPAGITKINGVLFGLGQVYVTTDHDLYFGSSASMLMEHVFDAGPDKRYRALGIDPTGQLWVGGDEAMVDGAVRTPLPPIAAAPIHTFFGGDDKIFAIAGSIGVAGVREAWIGGDGGIARVPDVASPDQLTVYSVAAGNWPAALNEKGRAIAYDRSTGDTFIAVQTGLARFKRDAGVVVPLLGSICGYTGDLRDVAIDSQRRRIFLGTMDGGFWIE